MPYLLRNPDNPNERATVDDLSDYPGWELVGDFPPQPHQYAELVEGAWVTPMQLLRAEVREKVNEFRSKAEYSLADTPFGRVNADDESQRRINGLVMMATLAKMAAQPFEQDFTMADNSVVHLASADQMIGLGVAVGRHVAAVHARGRELKAAIKDATTEAQLKAIDVGAGWP